MSVLYMFEAEQAISSSLGEKMYIWNLMTSFLI